MTVQLDTRGVEALTGDMLLPAVVWGQLVNEWGELPQPPVIDPFDEGPWRQQREQLDLLESPPLQVLFHQIVSGLTHTVPDVPLYLSEQRLLAEIELGWIRQRELQDAAGGCAVDVGGSEEDACVSPAEAGGGGAGVPGGPQDGEPVGGAEEVGGKKNRRSSQKVPRGRRAETSG